MKRLTHDGEIGGDGRIFWAGIIGSEMLDPFRVLDDVKMHAVAVSNRPFPVMV